MKKILALLLTLSLLFGLTACSTGEETSTEGTIGTTEATENTESATQPATTQAQSTEEVRETIAPNVAYVDGDDYYDFDCSKDLDEKGYYNAFDPRDYVTLPESLAVSIPLDVHTPTDEAVQKELDDLLSFYGTAEEVYDRAVADGDTINIDYVGKLDGVEFQGGSTGGFGTEVTVGVTNYVDDFLQKLIGHMPGETFDIDIHFPADYSNTSLADQDTVFTVTINYIVGATILPEMTDDFVLESLYPTYGWTTVEEVRADITADLAAEGMEDYLYDYIMSNSTVEKVPQELIDYMTNYFIYYHSYVAEGYEVTLPVLVSSYGFESMADMLSDYGPDIQSACKEEVVMQAVAKELGVDLTAADLEEYFMQEVGRTDYSIYEENFGLPYVKKMAQAWKVLTIMQEQATLLEE